jgi:4-alpha-glucanotransferase
VDFMARKQPYPEAAQRFWQFEFFRQWLSLKEYANRKGIRIMGDMPIYVAGDSADVVSHPEMFREDFVAGVPPDYFSATGQLWGNPVYRWDEMERTGFKWWIDRFRHTLETVDMLRLDHFRGFEAYWQVPAGSATAQNGEWVKGPGVSLFEALESKLGALPIVAENLGVITPSVEAIRHRFGFPGMSVLQFAFGTDPQAPTFRPHNYPREVVAYTGTHDNDTTVGWWNSNAAKGSTRSEEDIRKERQFMLKYLRTDGGEINWAFIETVMASVANTVLVPLQDVIGLGTEGRMNLPGKPDGNWQWRYSTGMLSSQHERRLNELTNLYDR